MSRLHHHHHGRRSPLEIRELAEFDATLGDVSDEEKRRRRVIYIRDAVQQISMGKKAMKGMVNSTERFTRFPWVLIPIFWPFAFISWLMKKNLSLMENLMNSTLDSQLANALDYWKIEPVEIVGSEDG